MPAKTEANHQQPTPVLEPQKVRIHFDKPRWVKGWPGAMKQVPGELHGNWIHLQGPQERAPKLRIHINGLFIEYVDDLPPA